MQTKLTLRMDEALIEQAKRYAKEQGKSLSQVVADYFAAFASPPEKQPLAPATQSLLGIMKDNPADENDYKQHLEEKYL